MIHWVISYRRCGEEVNDVEFTTLTMNGFDNDLKAVYGTSSSEEIVGLQGLNLGAGSSFF